MWKDPREDIHKILSNANLKAITTPLRDIFLFNTKNIIMYKQILARCIVFLLVYLLQTLTLHLIGKGSILFNAKRHA